VGEDRTIFEYEMKIVREKRRYSQENSHYKEFVFFSPGLKCFCHVFTFETNNLTVLAIQDILKLSNESIIFICVPPGVRLFLDFLFPIVILGIVMVNPLNIKNEGL